MKRRSLLIALLSLVAIGVSGCCESETPTPEDPGTCDPEFEDCSVEPTLESYTASNYSYDDSVSNEDGSVAYEIFVRSFYDSDDDGIGDLAGVTEKLGYLSELGVKTLWLMPIMPSPSYHGYDVNDYYAINPDYGTMEDFEELVSEASKLNIDIMIDIVFNHSSNVNQWFIDSYNDFKNNNEAEGSKKDWYCWSETSRGGYNRYQTDNNAYYESRFSYTMPDFNTENQEVRDEMVKILDFWIDKGVKGFRFDAVLYFDYNNSTYNANFLTYLKENIKDPSTYFVGECWANIDIINQYYNSKCDSFFKFNASLEGSSNDAFLGQVKALRSANLFANAIEQQEKTMKEANPDAYSSYFLSNHDMNRASNSFYTPIWSKLAASLYLLMPGRPYIYYGEEIMLKGVRNTSPDDQTDVMRRLPMVWSKDDKTGECDFPEKGKESLASNVDQVKDGADDLLGSGYSVVDHYKKVIQIRNKYPFILNSVFTNECSKLVSDSDLTNVLAYRLSYGDESIVIIHNFSNKNKSIDISKIGGEILDEVSCVNLVPTLSGNTLNIGKQSTVVLG